MPMPVIKEKKKMHIKRDDDVVVISGKDKGKRGKILVAHPSKGTVVIQGVNIVKKHQKARAQGQQGGIVQMEAPVNASNVMLFCSKCGKGVRTGKKILSGGQKVRVCVKCGEQFDAK